MPLSRELPPLSAPVDDTDHVIGNPSAQITLLQYGDFECPDCFNADPIVKQVRQQFGDQLRFAYRHFPLSTIHPRASVAAQAAEAAGAQGRFWEMADKLLANQRRLAELDLTHLAVTIGIDPYRFEADLSSERFVKIVQHHVRTGERSGVKGTPTFFVNSIRYRGTVTADELSTAIQEART